MIVTEALAIWQCPLEFFHAGIGIERRRRNVSSLELAQSGKVGELLHR